MPGCGEEGQGDGVLVCAGAGQGACVALPVLDDRLEPVELIGLDIDGAVLAEARERVRNTCTYATLVEADSDAPLADLFDAEGTALGPSGGRRGHVTGTFFHAIAREENLAGEQKIAKLA